MRALATDPGVDSVLGVARRVPPADDLGAEWAAADIATDPLEQLFHGADAVVSLAWRIQPSRRLTELWRTNVHGSSRVFEAVGRAGVPRLVYASSVGAYSPARRDRRVDESWPTLGIPSSFYARHKAEVERRLDGFEREHPATRVVRMRTSLVFQRASAEEQRRLFIGPLLPSSLLRRGVLPFVPTVRGLEFQAVHATDAAEAYRLALHSDVGGAFNVAAEPVLDEAAVARELGTRALPVRARFARAGLTATWRLRLQPTPPGWLDMGMCVPLLDTTRVRSTLGWSAGYDATATIRELLDGLRQRQGARTPALDPATSGRLRGRELFALARGKELV